MRASVLVMQSFDAWATAGHNNTTTAMAIIRMFKIEFTGQAMPVLEAPGNPIAAWVGHNETCVLSLMSEFWVNSGTARRRYASHAADRKRDLSLEPIGKGVVCGVMDHHLELLGFGQASGPQVVDELSDGRQWCPLLGVEQPTETDLSLWVRLASCEVRRSVAQDLSHLPSALPVHDRGDLHLPIL